MPATADSYFDTEYHDFLGESVDFKIKSSSLRDRQELFQEFLGPKLAAIGRNIELGTADFDSKTLESLLKIVRTTISRYNDKKSRSLVTDFLHSIYDLCISRVHQRPELLSGLFKFTRKLVENSTKTDKFLMNGEFFSSVASSECYNIWSWSHSICEKHIAYMDSQNAKVNGLDHVLLLEDILFPYGIILESVIFGIKEASARSVVQRKAAKMVNSRTIKANYRNLLSKKPSKIRYLIGITFSSNYQDEKIDPNTYQMVLDYFYETVFDSKVRVPGLYIAAFNYLYESLSFDEFKSRFGSSSVKLFLRSPEVIVITLSRVIPHVNFDFSDVATLWLPSMVQVLTSIDSKIRSDASKLWESVIKKIAQEEIREDMLNELTSLISKSGTSVDAKTVSIDCISYFPTDFVTKRMKKLVSLLDKERAESLKIKLIEVFSEFFSSSSSLPQLSADTSAFEDKIVDIIRNGSINAKKALLRKFPVALCTKLCSNTTLVDNLLKIVSTCQNSQLVDSVTLGYHAIFVLCKLKLCIHEDKNELSKKIDENIESIAGPESFLLSPKRLNQVTGREESKAFLAIIEAFLSLNSQISFEKIVGRLSKYIVHICIHGSASELPRAIAIVEALLKSDIFSEDSLANNILGDIVAQWDKLLGTVKDDERFVIAQQSFGKRFKRLLYSLKNFPNRWKLTDKTQLIQKRLLKVLPLMSHSIIGKPKCLFMWTTFCDLAMKSHETNYDCKMLLRDNAEDLVSNYFSDSQMFSDNYYLRDAAFNSLNSMIKCSPRLLPEVMLKKISALSVDLCIDTIEISDLKIWNTHEGSLCFDVLKSRNSSDNSRYQKKEEWELKLEAKREKERKLTKEEKKKVDEALLSEAKVRNRVQQAKNIWDVSFETISKICRILQSDYIPHIPMSMNLAIGLLNDTCHLGQRQLDLGFNLAEEAFYSLDCLVDCCMPSFRGSAKLLLSLLFKTRNYTGHPHDLTVLDTFQKTRNMMELLLEKTDPEIFAQNEPLSPYIFAFFFVYIKDFIEIEHPSNEDIYQHVIHLIVQFFGVHCKLLWELKTSKDIMLRLLFQMIDEFPQHSRKLQEIISFFISSIEKNISESEFQVVMDALLCNNAEVRKTSLRALINLQVPESMAANYATCIWILQFDENDVNSMISRDLWESGEMEIGPDYRNFLVPMLLHDSESIRSCTCKAIHEAMKIHSSTKFETLADIFDLYVEEVKPPTPKYDGFGLVIPGSLEKPDNWFLRASIAEAIKECTDFMDMTDVKNLLGFLLISPASLGDENIVVRQTMVNAAKRVIDLHGKNYLDLILGLLNDYLDSPALDNSTHDLIRESAIVILGAAAKHLDPEDDRTPQIIEKLISTLNTPSEPVQEAVADCLGPLIKITKKKGISGYVENLLLHTVTGSTMAERRGSAFGLAGVLKGSGLPSIKEFDIINHIKSAIEDKKSPESRQGGLFLIETLSRLFKRLFEPYVMPVLPHLLGCFGDSSLDVRSAAIEAAMVITSGLSSHCVKLVLPAVLDGLEDTKWRTKVGSVEMLGAFSNLAPKQLSANLPTIIPKLTDVLKDSHKNVRQSAANALENFTNIVGNPEIKQMSPTLMKALADPTKDTMLALNCLINTRFSHLIDAPSLALVVPVLERGLKERGTEIKKRSSHILGSIISLVEKKDFLPYLPKFLPLLREILIDPVPEARSIAARAIGILVSKMGEENFPSLVTDLFRILKSNGTGVDRQGSAQGLAEVLAGVGTERLDQVMPEIIANSHSDKAYMREGSVILLTFLPATFKENFVPYLQNAVSCLLDGISDEYEHVRDASMKACYAIIDRFSQKSVELLLPHLESGLFDGNWRVRESCVKLLGELFYKISGIRGKTYMEEDEEDEYGSETGRRAIVQSIGQDKFNSILAALFVARFDSTAIVRQISVQVWKTVVVNTPKTLKQILEKILSLIIDGLSSSNEERKTVSLDCLRDLMQKLGGHVLSKAITILRAKMSQGEDQVRSGSALALAEMITHGGKHHLELYYDELIEMIYISLKDPIAEVRRSGAVSFDGLQRCMGNKVIDNIIPRLLSELEDTSSTEGAIALEALKEIMEIRSNLFPSLAPSLTAKPITLFHARALTALIRVAGSSTVSRKLTSITENLMESLESTDHEEQLLEALEALMHSVDDPDVLENLMYYLQESASMDQLPFKKIGACHCIEYLAESEDLPSSFSLYIGEWFKILIDMLQCRSQSGGMKLVECAWKALYSLVKSIPKEDLFDFVAPARRHLMMKLKTLSSDKNESLDGLALPKGIGCLLPIFQHGLMYGEPEVKEQSALAIGDLISAATQQSIKPFVVQLSGIIIRIVGDKYPQVVKSAVLKDLKLILEKCSLMVKPFVPQLQRTLLKAVIDEDPSVHEEATSCMIEFMSILPQSDTLFREMEKCISDENPTNNMRIKKILISVVDRADATENTMKKSRTLLDKL